MTVGGALERKFGCRIASVVWKDDSQVTGSELVACIQKMNSTRAKAFIRTFLMGLGFHLHSTNTFASLLWERPYARQDGQREEAEILFLSSKIPSSVGRQKKKDKYFKKLTKITQSQKGRLTRTVCSDTQSWLYARKYHMF